MNTIETEFAIGDVVYTGTEYGVDKKIIKAIKVKTIKKTVSYGFDSQSSMWMFHEDYSWYDKDTIFATEEEATKKSEKLKALKEKKEAKEKLEAYAKRKTQLEQELAELTPESVDPDDVEEDD